MSVARRLGRYLVGERIGTGGVADVYRAQVEGAAGFAKTLVVKCLRPHVAAEPELVDGLAREAKLAQRLHHGNIVQVFDFGVEDGQPYVVMEHVDGCSLHELLFDMAERSEPLGLEEALFVFEELAAALRYVHGLTDDDGAPLHLVHRDVKPRNVLVSREGVVKLTDFGIAKVSGDRDDTLPGVIKGTPAYLSPEQAMSRGVDARTDVFALGLTLRDLLGDGLESELPADPRVDDQLRAICERATSDRPADRYEDIPAMLKAVQRWRAGHEIDAHPGRLAAWVRRARQQAPIAAPKSLDAALLGGAASYESTRPGGPEPHTTRPGTLDASDASRRLHPVFLVLIAALAIGGVLWAVLADTTSPAPPPAAEAQMEATHPGPEPSAPPSDPEPPRAPEPAAAGTGPSVSSPAASSTSSDGASTTDPAESSPPDESTATESRTSEPDARPRPKARTGRLVVSLLPWAEVTIDGRPHGRVPVEVELTAGRHRVRLKNPQLGTVDKVVQVRAGQTTTLNKW